MCVCAVLWSWATLGLGGGAAAPASGAGAGIGDVAAGGTCQLDADCASSGGVHICTLAGSTDGSVCGLICAAQPEPLLAFGAAVGAATDCSRGLVPVATINIDLNGAVSASDVPFLSSTGASRVSPVSVNRGATNQQFIVRLAKVAAPGVHRVSFTARYQNGRAATVDADVTVTCPDTTANAGVNNTLSVTADLQGLQAADFGAADHALAVRTQLAGGLGVDVAGVTLLGSTDTGTGVRLSLTADVPVAELPQDKTVAVVLDASRLAGAALATKQLAFVHMARVVSRAAGVCCTATIVAV